MLCVVIEEGGAGRSTGINSRYGRAGACEREHMVFKRADFSWGDMSGWVARGGQTVFAPEFSTRPSLELLARNVLDAGSATGGTHGVGVELIILYWVCIVFLFVRASSSRS